MHVIAATRRDLGLELAALLRSLDAVVAAGLAPPFEQAPQGYRAEQGRGGQDEAGTAGRLALDDESV